MGRFKIIKLLGEGGMGKVYLAESEGQSIALKFLDPRVGKASLGFFRSEVQLLSRLSHPNLVKIHDFYSEPGELIEFSVHFPKNLRKAPFFSMEYLEGQALDTFPRTVSSQEILILVAQIFRGLHYLHARNILHRDLKPSNIQVLRSGQAKILDFNLSSGLQPEGRRSPAMGTLPYMPPEAYQGEYLTQSDLFSLGVVLYQVLSGDLPFSKPLLQISLSESRAPRLDQRRPDLPEFLVDLVHRLLEFSPARRPSSALAVLKFLNQHLETPLPLLAEGAASVVLEKTPMVGRDAEWKKMSDLELRQSGEEHPAFVVLKGPMGVGRSRFLEEWKWHSQLAGKIYLALLPENSASWLEKISDGVGLDPPSENLDILSRFREFLKRAPPKPCVLAFCDLHEWPEKNLETLQLFLKLASHASLPWIIFLESREEPEQKKSPDFLSSQEFLKSVETLRLGDLNPEQALELLSLANPDLPLPETKVKEILSQANGRPLLLLEELRYALEKNNETPPAEEPKPSPARNLEKFAALRIQNLSPPAQDLLSLLLANSHPTRAEEAERLIHPPSAANFQDALLELDEKGILAPRSTQEPSLRLAHPSLREAFSKTLPETSLKRSHHLWIEYLSTPASSERDSPERIFALAEHAWAAEDIPTLKLWGLKAAEALFHEGPPFQALRWFQRLLPYAETPGEKYVLHAHLALLHFRLGNFDEALKDYDLWFANRVDDESRLQKVKYLYHTGLFLFTAGRESLAQSRLEECLTIGNGEKYPAHRPYLARTHCTLAAILEKTWNMDEARRHLHSALELAQEIPMLLGEVEQLLGSLEQKTLNFVPAKEHFQRSLQFYREAKNPQAEAIALDLLGMLDRECGELEAAEDSLKKSRELMLRSGEIMQWGRYSENLGLVYLDRADYSQARRVMEEAEEVLALWAQEKDRERMEINRARLYLFLGNWERSQKILDRLSPEGKKFSNPDFPYYLAQLRGEAAYLQGNYASALSEFERALQTSDPQRTGLASLSALLGICRSQARLGQLPKDNRLEETLRRTQVLPFPFFQLWNRSLQFLGSPSEALQEKDIPLLIKQLLHYPGPEVRIDVLELLALDLKARGLKEACAWAADKREEELEKIFQSLPEENKIDFDKNRKG